MFIFRHYLSFIYLFFCPERGAQVLPDLWVQAELWPPPLPGALSPRKLWTLLAVRYVLHSFIYKLSLKSNIKLHSCRKPSHLKFLHNLWFLSFVVLSVTERVMAPPVGRFWWADMPLWAHSVVPTYPLWHKATRVQKHVHKKTRVWPSR